jgi:chromatin remodeling complex protein RSC6
MPAAAAATATGGAGKKKKARASSSAGKKNNALDRPVGISDDLEAVVGKGPMGRTTITKKLWEYIKRHSLQDPEKRRMIRPDEKLKKIIGSTAIDMMKLQTHLSKHIRS